MKRLFLFVLYLLFLQNTDIYGFSNQTQKDTIRESYEYFIQKLEETKPDSLKQMILYGEKAALYADSTNIDTLRATVYNQIGLQYYYKSNFSLAGKYFEQSAQIEEKLQNHLNRAKMLSNIATIHDMHGEYEKAIANYVEAQKIFEREKFRKGLAFVYNNIAVIYVEMKRHEDAIKYHKLALALKTELGDSLGMASSFNNLGVIHEEFFANHDSAIFYYQSAIDIYRKKNMLINYATSLQNIAGIKQTIGLHNEALTLYKQALDVFTNQNNKQGLAWCHRNIGRLYSQIKNNEQAFEHLNKGLEISKEISDKKTELKITGLLAELHYTTANYQTSADMYKSYNILTDSLTNIEKQKQIDELTIKYETTQLQYNIDNLKYENKIKTQNIRTNRIIIISFIVCTTLLIIGFALWRTRTKLRNEHKQTVLNRKLLRLQMNPHFISNALSAIQNFILQNKTEMAANYISDFSRLMRQTIKNTRNEFISLDEEIQYLTDYIKIQQLRFNNLFDFSLSIAEEIDTENTLIPPMFIQPFIENAINHGFSNINYKGLLNLQIEKLNDLLKITITDNGIGLKQKEENSTKDVSYSVDITKERIKHLKNKKASFCIFDNKEIDKTGVDVIITIPFWED